MFVYQNVLQKRFAKTSSFCKKQRISGLPFAVVFLKLKFDFRSIICDKHRDTDHPDTEKGGYTTF